MPTDRPHRPSRSRSFAPPLPFWPAALDALPRALNHLLDAEPWARQQLVRHAGKTVHVVVPPFTVRLTVDATGRVARAVDAPADATVTVPYGTVLHALAASSTTQAPPLSDLRIDGDADFVHTISQVARELRWDVEEDLSKVVGDVAARRLVTGARRIGSELGRGRDRLAASVAEYLLEENPQLVRPHAVDALAAGVRTLRDDLARLEKRIDRLTLAG